MEGMYKGNARNKQIPPTGITRRGFIRGLAALGGAYVASKVEANLIPSPKDVSPKENIRFLKTQKYLDVSINGVPTKFKVPTVYAQFRGNIFELNQIRARDGDDPLALIYGADRKFNPGVDIKPNLASKAGELFDIVAENKDKLGALEKNTIRNLSVKRTISPAIQGGVIYDVPVYTPYSSLEEVLVNNAQAHTKFI